MSITIDAPSPQRVDTSAFVCDWYAQRVVFADNALDQLAEEVDLLPAKRVLLITDAPGELPARAARLLGHRLALHWDDVRAHVPAELAEIVTGKAREYGVEAVVSVGGGSATGLAKAVALETGIAVLAVPTTYAGSEMTPVWGRTDGQVKTTGRDRRVLPRTVIYDAVLLSTLPASLVGASAMNALAHCVEALYAPNAEPMTSLAALEGARLIGEFLPGAYHNADPSALRQVLWASCLAGRAFGTVGGSLHHSLCHLLGGAADLPHADTHAVVLPHVIAFLAPAIEDQLADIARSLNCDSANVAGAIWDLGASVATKRGLAGLGLTREAIPQLAQMLVDKQPHSPRPITYADALELITSAWVGERPGVGKTTPAELTNTVLERLQGTPDPRLREVMTALVRQLHKFVGDVRLTHSEWLAAIEFLTATGQICSDSRQEFILLSDTLGVSMLVDLLSEHSSDNSAHQATESTVLGPFYLADSPERGYGSSIVEVPSGEPAWVSGIVMDTDGRPLADATVDVWQNADDMLYAVQNPDTPLTNLRGTFHTRPDGSYAFWAVRPTDYPIPDDGPVGQLLIATARHPWRPAHIHMVVGAREHDSVTTHVFDSESQYLDSDSVFAVKASLVQHFDWHESAADAPPGGPNDQGWYSLQYDFYLTPSIAQHSSL